MPKLGGNYSFGLGIRLGFNATTIRGGRTQDWQKPGSRDACVSP